MGQDLNKYPQPDKQKTMELRDYQVQAIHDLRASIREGNRSPVLVLSTGSGKTLVSVKILEMAIEKGNRTLFLAPRRELVYQTGKSLESIGFNNYGLIMAGEETNPEAPVQIASVSTIHRRYLVNKNPLRPPPPLPPAQIIVIDECFTGNMEILTESGFIRFDELDKSLKVAQVNDDGIVSFVRPERFIENPYTGPIVTGTNKKTLDFSVTPNHQILTKKKGEKTYTKKRADKLHKNDFLPVASWATHFPETLSPLERFAIALQADGSFRENNGKGYSFEFQFSKERKIIRLNEICREGGYNIKEVKKCQGRRRFLVHNMPPVFKDLYKTFDLTKITGGKAKSIIDEMVEWDGHKVITGSFYYSSVIKEMTDFYQAIAIIAGYKTNRAIQVDSRKESHRDVYRLFIDLHRNSVSTQQGINKTQYYNGKVYCVQVPAGKIIVRRNGKALITGNCHVNMSAMMKKILAEYPNSIRISLTATPVRSDGRGLGEICDDLITGPSMKELTAMGHLLPVRYFAPSKPDLEKVRTMAGDYREDDLEKVMNQKKLVGDVVENWLRICPDRQTVVFAVNRAHAMSLYKEFVRIGISTAYLDGNTPNEERADIIKQLEDGDIQVVASVEVLSFGWDAPVVSCGIIARPTKSVARYLQSAGRILRPYPGQKDAILIDHGGVVDELGFLDSDQPWSLDGKEKIQDRKKQKEKTEPKPIECYQCKSLIRPQKECPQCGADLSGQAAKAIEAHEAELQEIFREEQAKEHAKRSREWSMEAKADFYAQLRWICKERGYKDGYAARKYRDKLGVWPKGMGKPEPKKPTKETFAWVRHQQIKYAKAKEAASA